MKKKIIIVLLLLMVSSVFGFAESIKNDQDKARLGLAQSLANLKKYDEARNILEEVRAKCPRDNNLKGEIADIYYEMNDYLTAEIIYREILAKEDSLDIRKKLGEVLIWQKKYSEGVVIIKDLIKLQPDKLDLIELLADAYSWQKDYEPAIELYKQLIAKQFETKRIVLKLADSLRLSGNNEEAVAFYNKYLNQ